MKILPNELPTKKPIQKRQPVRTGKQGRKAEINWAKFAPMVDGKTYKEAVEIIGCSRAALVNAVDKGWVNCYPTPKNKYHWNDYKDQAANSNPVDFARKTGIPITTVYYAVREGKLVFGGNND